MQHSRASILYRSLLVLLFLFLSCTGCRKETNNTQQENYYYNKAILALNDNKPADAYIWLEKALQQDASQAEVHFQLGKILRQRGANKQAYKELTRAVALKQNFTEAQKELADFLISQQAFQSAIRLCRQYLKNQGPDPDIYLMLGNALIGVQLYGDAVSLLQQAVRKYPDDLKLQVTLVNALLTSGEEDKAQQLMAQLVSDHPHDMHILLAQSLLYEQMAFPERRVQSLEQIIADFPKQPLPYLILARVLIRQHQADQARKILQQGLSSGLTDSNMHKMLAMIASQQGKKQEAKKHFLKAIALADSAQQTEDRLLLVDYYIHLKEYTKAEKIIRELLKRNGNVPQLQARQAQLSMACGHIAEAKSIVAKLLRQHPDYDKAHLLQGMLLLQDGKTEEARKFFARARELAPKSGANQLLYGLTFMDSSTNISMAEISKALLKNPALIMGHLALAQLYAQNGKIQKALAETDIFLAEKPENDRARTLRISLLVRAGELQRALQDARFLADKHPDDDTALLRLAEILVLATQPDQAEAIYTKIRKRSPDNIDALRGLVELDLREKNYTAALNRVNAYLTEFPASDEALIIKARIFFSQQEIDRAASLLHRVADKQPDNPRLLVLLADLFQRTGKEDQALSLYNQAMELDPENLIIGLQLADLLMRKGKTDQAISLYEKILSLDNTIIPALNNLAFLYAETGEKLDRALELARMAYERQPKSASITDTLGWIYVQKNSFNLARSYLSMARKLKPDSPVILFHLAQLYYRQHRATQTLHLLQQAMSIGLAGRLRHEAETIIQRLQHVLAQLKKSRQLRNKGDLKQARLLLEQLRSQGDKSIETSSTLARIYADMGEQPELAMTLAEEGYAADSTNAEAADILGWVYLQQNQLLLAEQYIKQALDEEQKTPLYHYHYGVLLFKKGNFKEARQELELSLQLNLNLFDRSKVRHLLQQIPTEPALQSTAK